MARCSFPMKERTICKVTGFHKKAMFRIPKNSVVIIFLEEGGRLLNDPLSSSAIK